MSRTTTAQRIRVRARRRSLLASFALGLVALTSLPACFGVYIKPEWVERQVNHPSFQVLWEYSLAALSREAFPIGAGANPGKGEIRTNWKYDMQAFSRRGNRKRATLRLEALGDGDYKVDARVEVEINKDVSNPLDRTHAKWEASPDDRMTANRLVQLVYSRVGVPLKADIDPRVFEGTIQTVVVAGSPTAIRDLATEVFDEQGYGVSPNPAFHPEELSSGWSLDLRRARGKGARFRVKLWYETLGGPRYRLRTKVHRQKNTERIYPLDAGQAKWEVDGIDAERTQAFLDALVERLESRRL